MNFFDIGGNNLAALRTSDLYFTGWDACEHLLL